MTATETFQLNLIFEVSKILLTALAFILTMSEYRHGQQWKRKEYVSAQMEKFTKDPDVVLAMQMLDWLERPLILKSGRQFDLNRKSLKKILMGEKESNKITFSIEEAELRDSFAKFLDYLQQFDSDIESGLVNKEDLEVYLAYWIRKLSKAELPEEKDVIKIVDKFINDYGYTGVTRLVGRYIKTEPNSLILASRNQ